MSKCRGLTARARTGNWSIHYKTCYRGGTDGGALPIRKTRSRMPRTGLIPANSRTSHPNVSCSFLIRGRLFRLACWSDEYLATSTWLRWKYPSGAEGSTVSRRSPGAFLRTTWLATGRIWFIEFARYFQTYLSPHFDRTIRFSDNNFSHKSRALQ